MVLSKAERLMLYNQYEILKKLEDCKIHSHTELYDICQEILVNGYKQQYQTIFDGFSEPISDDIASLVQKTLQIYQMLLMSYNQLKPEEKEQLDTEDIKFEGFDGNEEIEYYSYAKFLLEVFQKYPQLYDKRFYTLNSHWPNATKYQNMISKFESLNTHGNFLTLKQIKAIVNPK
ncbi:YfbU family protein [Caproicibacterium sp. NSD3]